MCKAQDLLKTITPQRLDDYLSQGWFRMDQFMFTTRFVEHDGRFYEAVWLRHRLDDVLFPSWFMKLLDKDIFRIEVCSGLSTPAHEILFQKYRESKPVDWPCSLEDVLYGNRSKNVFDTQIINVYHGTKLIAAGFFDLGATSAAGICNFYDPEYKSFSLGKFLYLYEMLICTERGLEFFYPGYMTPGLPLFDYKCTINPCSLESYDPITRSWENYQPTAFGLTAVDKIQLALCGLLPRLQSLGIEARLVTNAGFNLDYSSKYDMPYALFIFPPEGRKEQYAITYDPDTSEYYIFDCTVSNCMHSLRAIGQETFCVRPLNLKTPLFILMSPGPAADTMADIVEYWEKK